MKTFLTAAAISIAVSALVAQSDAAGFRERALAHNARNETTQALAALDAGLKRSPSDPGLLAAKGQIYWRLLRTKSAEEALRKAAQSPEYAAEAQYWLGRIYLFKGWQAEGAFPGWHEQVEYRPRAIAAFTAARDLRPEWDLPRAALAEIAAGPATSAPPDVTIAKLDAQLAAFATQQTAPLADVQAAIKARLALRPDPMSHTAAANLLLARQVDLARVEEIAQAGREAGELFIRENEDSYKLDGKVQGSLDRNAATFADLAGWAAYLQKRPAVAERRLAEAERLFRGVDVNNQWHLAQLSRDKGDLDVALDHYLNVLDLAAASPQVRETARDAIAAIRRAQGETAEGFDAWLSDTLARRREERRKALLASMEGKAAPPLRLQDLQGHPVDLEAERGNVVLLNFFSAW
jgi:tetratricopeptide (TPR) repeat protein